MTVQYPFSVTNTIIKPKECASSYTNKNPEQEEMQKTYKPPIIWVPAGLSNLKASNDSNSKHTLIKLQKIKNIANKSPDWERQSLPPGGGNLRITEDEWESGTKPRRCKKE